MIETKTVDPQTVNPELRHAVAWAMRTFVPAFGLDGDPVRYTFFRERQPGEFVDTAFDAPREVYGAVAAGGPVVYVHADLSPAQGVEVVVHELRHVRQWRDLGPPADEAERVLRENDAILCGQRVMREMGYAPGPTNGH